MPRSRLACTRKRNAPRCGLTGALVVVASLAGMLPARAAEGDVEPHVQLFHEARRLKAEGKIEQACELFERSERLRSSLGSLLNIGDCREREGRLGAALTAFQTVADRAAVLPDAAQRASYTSEAQLRVTSLRPRVPSLRLVAPPTPGARAFVDGRAAAFEEPLSLDPGPHRIEVGAPGHRSFSESVSLAEGQRLERRLAALAPASSARFGLVPPLLLGAGGLLVAGGVVWGSRALSGEEKLSERCDPPSVEDDAYCDQTLGDTRALARTSDWLWVSGALVAGAGLTLYVIDWSSEADEASESSPHADALSLRASPHALGVVAGGRF